MSQVTIVAQSGGGGGGTVTSVSGGNNITITGTPTINPTVNVSGTTNHAIQVGNASASLTSLAVATNGQLPIGSTGADPVVAALTPGAGISVTNGAGSITIANTASALSWVEVLGTSQAMAANTTYVANNAGLVTLTLPATAPFGTVISVVGKGAGGWSVVANTGQTIYFGNQTSSVAGSLSSTHQRDTIIVACITANTEWEVWHGPQGNLTVA